MNRLIKISLCSIYILSAAGFFFYLLFPSAAVQRSMANWVERRYPGVRLSVSRLQPKFPLGLSIASSQLLFQDVPLIGADTIQLTPRLDSPFRLPKRIAFQGNTSGGRFDGTIEFGGGEALQIQVDAGLTGGRIEKIPFFQQLNIDDLSGVCDSRIRSGEGGSIAVQLKISECKGVLSSCSSGDTRSDSMPEREAFSFQYVQADLDFRKGEVKVREALFEVGKLKGTVSGSIFIKEPIGKSLLKLTGKMSTDLRLQAGLEERTPMQLLSERSPFSPDVTIEIEGSIEKPVFSFQGRS